MARAAIMLLLLSGCTVSDAPAVSDPSTVAATPIAQDELRGFKWRAVEIGGLPLVPASEVYMRFDGDRVHGGSGCNSYGGRHEVLAGGRLRFGTLAATRMGCFSEEIGDQERRFYQILGDTMGYLVETIGPDEVRLTLTAADGGRLVFRREPWAPREPGPPPPPFPRTSLSAILDREWRAVTIHGEPVVGGSRLSLRLADGRVTGHGGCNGFGGPFDVLRETEQKIRFGALTATRRACTDPEMNAQERRFLDALQGTLIYSVDEAGQLTLTAANMRTIVLRPAAGGQAR